MDGGKRFNYAMCGRVFFKNGEKKYCICFQKYSNTCGQDVIVFTELGL